MAEYEDIAARFAADTEQHEMTVRHDDGLYRHLRFAKPGRGSWSYWFDILTWPGVLHVRGDIGTSYTFSGLADMFEFFRNPGGRINPHYWAEKLDDGRASVRVYSEGKLRRRVTDHFVETVREGGVPYGTGMALRKQVLNQDLSVEDEARDVLDGFSYGGSGRLEFRDLWEWDFTDYDWLFLWACHAIVAGIQQYDAWRLTVPAHRPDMPTTYEYGGQTWDLTKSYYDDCGEVWENRGWWLGDVPLMWSVDSDGKPLHDPVPFGDAWHGDLQVWRSKP